MKKIFFTAIITSLIAVSCNTDQATFDGPSLQDIYGEFFIVNGLAVNTNAVDFAAGQSLICTAEFSKNVNWKIEITGLESGALFTLEGFSRLLSGNDGKWDGSATTLPMFRNESCEVRLTILNEPDTLRDTVTVLSTKPIVGFLLSDFESGWNAGWGSFVQSGGDMSFNITDEVSAGQGTKYYDMGGEVNWDYLIGLVDIPATAYGTTTYPLNANPNNVYFNVMLSKIAGLSNAIVLFQFREDDNGDGVYTDGAEDLFSIQVNLTGQNGWQLLTNKYEDIPTLINGVPSAAIGNGIHEPDKLLMVSVLMLANPATGYSQAFMDLLIFTENAPFKP